MSHTGNILTDEQKSSSKAADDFNPQVYTGAVIEVGLVNDLQMPAGCFLMSCRAGNVPPNYLFVRRRNLPGEVLNS